MIYRKFRRKDGFISKINDRHVVSIAPIVQLVNGEEKEVGVEVHTSRGDKWEYVEEVRHEK